MQAIITAILPVLLQLLEEIPSLVDEVKTAWDLLTSQQAPTAAQQTAIDSALDAAHAALQGAGATGTTP